MKWPDGMGKNTFPKHEQEVDYLCYCFWDLWLACLRSLTLGRAVGSSGSLVRKERLVKWNTSSPTNCCNQGKAHKPLTLQKDQRKEQIDKLSSTRTLNYSHRVSILELRCGRKLVNGCFSALCIHLFIKKQGNLSSQSIEKKHQP